MNARELMAELANDPEFQARQAARDREHNEKVAALAAESQPLLRDLAAAGVRVETVGDFVSRKEPYPSALPVLVAHLAKPYTKPIRECIVRALTVPEARGLAGQPLLKAFYQEEDANQKWVIGNALRVVADEAEYDEVVDILNDKSYGQARSGLAHAVARLRDADAIPLLLPLLDDEDQLVATEAIIALGELRAEEAREGIERYTKHHDSWVRDKARRALKKLDTAAKRRRSRK
jgi:hypothetical protein